MERDRAIMEHTADVLFVYDPEDRIFDVNQRACDTLGDAREGLLSLSNNGRQDRTPARGPRRVVTAVEEGKNRYEVHDPGTSARG